MAHRFTPLTLDEFQALLDSFPASGRKIDAVHMHHTWRPTHAQFQGEDSVEAMWRHHTQVNGWSDIAQHVTIAPDGVIWTGRDWNKPPASASGFNGSTTSGPFMFETVGDFDIGRDRLEGKQRQAAIDVIARVQRRFGLGPDSLRFHRDMTDQKTCPGTSLRIEDIKQEVASARVGLDATRAARPREAWADAESLRGRERTAAIFGTWREAEVAVDPVGAEPDESERSEEYWRVAASPTLRAPAREGAASRDAGMTPDMLADLRPHVVNLNQGKFSDEGGFRTTEGDVKAIFAEHLPRAHEAAKAAGRPLRIVFWAHGGLTSEAAGLGIAHLQVKWWKDNGAYPIHFVWETGFLDALRQILSGTRDLAPRGAARDIFDHTTDPAVEALARAMGGVKIWSAMKTSADLACRADGGATFVARGLAEFCAAHPDVELHAVGHSAGSIFHSHFLPVAFRLKAPPFKSLQFLAPAIRVDGFVERLSGLVGKDKEIQSLRMLTMQRDWEEADNTAGVYRKSLLYLIFHALEREREAPILGLEISVRSDARLARLFGLDGSPGPADVVWAVTRATSGPNASTSKTHGGFDNDGPTMNAVAQHILAAAPAVTFPQEAAARAIDVAMRGPDLPPAVTAILGTAGAAAAPPRPASPSPFRASPPASSEMPAGGGRRRALCVGIDVYATKPLAGCVADARAWAQTLDGLGFEVTMLLDGAATRAAILGALQALIGSGSPGDTLVFQYAGHGTEVEDVDGDETSGTNGARDEALCPIDISSGAFLIDDDLADVFAALPEGVALTCFIDCCHSGTITRVMVGPPDGGAGVDRRSRFLPLTGEMRDAHRSFRERTGSGRAMRSRSRSAEDMRQVVFSACRDYEVAWESQGHGDFTVRATQILSSGIAGLTNEEFQRRVIAAFGEGARQNPELDCATAGRTRMLLGSLGGGAPAAGPAGAGAGNAGTAHTAAVARALRAIADSLVAGS